VRPMDEQGEREGGKEEREEGAGRMSACRIWRIAGACWVQSRERRGCCPPCPPVSLTACWLSPPSLSISGYERLKEVHANLILDLGEVRSLAVEASSHLGQAVSQMQLSNVVSIVEELQGSVR
jgi:hypothetical protein